MFYIRKFEKEDFNAVYKLFYETVHTINRKDYSEEQVDAWAPKVPRDYILKNLIENYTYVALKKDTNQIVGYADIKRNGDIGHIYVHKDFQNQGIARALLQKLEDKAKELKLDQCVTDASITAVPFFEKMGYTIVQKNEPVRDSISMVNYTMSKSLT